MVEPVRPVSVPTMYTRRSGPCVCLRLGFWENVMIIVSEFGFNAYTRLYLMQHIVVFVT